MDVLMLRATMAPLFTATAARTAITVGAPITDGFIMAVFLAAFIIHG